MKFLLDSNACIEILRSRPDPKILERFLTVAHSDLAICTIVYMEVMNGALHKNSNAAYLHRTEKFLSALPCFSFDLISAKIYTEFYSLLAKQGRPIGMCDLMIGSIAAANNLIVVSHNKNDFDRIPNLKWEDWQL